MKIENKFFTENKCCLYNWLDENNIKKYGAFDLNAKHKPLVTSFLLYQFILNAFKEFKPLDRLGVIITCPNKKAFFVVIISQNNKNNEISKELQQLLFS